MMSFVRVSFLAAQSSQHKFTGVKGSKCSSTPGKLHSRVLRVFPPMRRKKGAPALCGEHDYGGRWRQRPLRHHCSASLTYQRNIALLPVLVMVEIGYWIFIFNGRRSCLPGYSRQKGRTKKAAAWNLNQAVNRQGQQLLIGCCGWNMQVSGVCNRRSPEPPPQISHEPQTPFVARCTLKSIWLMLQ